jgi:hypothetical protein
MSDPRPAGRPEVRHLVVFFATVYFVQSFIDTARWG